MKTHNNNNEKYDRNMNTRTFIVCSSNSKITSLSD